MLLREVGVEAEYMYCGPCSPFYGAYFALIFDGAPIDNRINGLVDHEFGETLIAEGQGGDSMGGAYPTLNGTDPAYPHGLSPYTLVVNVCSLSTHFASFIACLLFSLTCLRDLGKVSGGQRCGRLLSLMAGIQEYPGVWPLW